MGADFRGDPASAMLEVLDPEQNATFRDHYLDLPFDLSNVLFITTANQLDPIPGPLRDRMEIIELSGYTEEEKLEIAKRYLVPRQIERNGLSDARIEFADDALSAIIDGYTREAGVRNLEREIGSICRKVARGYADGTRTRKRTIRARQVRELLGKRRFHHEVAQRTSQPGVATGLAVTPVGGEVLFIEAAAYAGDGRLQITGQLGDVMKESAAAALSWVKGHVSKWGAENPEQWLREHDIHVHLPAGAIPKDGPSAGVALATALVSLITGRPVRSDVAMTGEITLTGQVLPIGGLKEKALAAQRAGIKCVIAPKQNEPDLDDLPDHLKKGIDFKFVSRIDQALLGGARAREEAAPPRPGALGRCEWPTGRRSPRSPPPAARWCSRSPPTPPSAPRTAPRASPSARCSWACAPCSSPRAPEDPTEEVRWGGGHATAVPGGTAHLAVEDGVVYLAIAVRNVGTGLAVLQAWYVTIGRSTGDEGYPEPGEFRRQRRDLYIPAGGTGFWQAALRDPEEELAKRVTAAIAEHGELTVFVMYGDHEGGQLTISLFGILPQDDGSWIAEVGRHWTLGIPDPRLRPD